MTGKGREKTVRDVARPPTTARRRRQRSRLRGGSVARERGWRRCWMGKGGRGGGGGFYRPADARAERPRAEKRARRDEDGVLRFRRREVGGDTVASGAPSSATECGCCCVAKGNREGSARSAGPSSSRPAQEGGGAWACGREGGGRPLG